MENSYSNRTAIASAFDLLSTRGGLNVYIRNRVVCRKIHLQSCWLNRLNKCCLASGMTCDSSQDGGWALVRRIVQGSQWFGTTDKLTGTHQWSDPSNAEIYTRYSHLLNPQTEFMFATGTRCNNTPFVDLRHCADFIIVQLTAPSGSSPLLLPLPTMELRTAEDLPQLMSSNPAQATNHVCEMLAIDAS